MKRVTLRRLETSNQGTFGVIDINGVRFFTGELPWRDNQSNVSCIPSGTYTCTFTYSPRFKRHMYLVKEVQGRAGVRIHSANLCGDKAMGFKAQLNGCVALGKRLGKIDGQKALLLSKPAVSEFESLMQREDFILEIVDCA